jgi:hypothetical protein
LETRSPISGGVPLLRGDDSRDNDDKEKGDELDAIVTVRTK